LDLPGQPRRQGLVSVDRRDDRARPAPLDQGRDQLGRTGRLAQDEQEIHAREIIG
jgi:hypothetical protein